jgi:hypothetical protein
MKWVIVIILLFNAACGLPPTNLKPQEGVNLTTFNFEVPNKQGTKTGGVNSLIETGNKNLLENPSFEHLTFSTGWTFTGTGSLTAEPTIIQSGKKSAKIEMTAQTAKLCQESTINAVQLAGLDMTMSVWIKGDAADGKICPYANGTEITSLCSTISTLNDWREYVTIFPAGSTSSGFCVEYASTTGTVYIDDAHVGVMPATMTPEVAQAEYFGGLSLLGATNCRWTTTAASWVTYSDDTDCNNYTEIGNIKAPSTKVPAFVIPAGSPSGSYRIVANFNYRRNNAISACWFRLTDGASSSAHILGNFVDITQVTDSSIPLEWAYDYVTSSTNTQINIQAYSNAGGECAVNPSVVGVSKSGFDVYYYPPKNKIYSNKSMGWYVDVNIGGANPSLGTSSVSTYTSISNGSLDMVINPGSQPAQIPCSGTNPSTGITCSAGDEQIGVVFDVPSVGTYEVCASFTRAINVPAAAFVASAFQLVETQNATQTILQEGKSRSVSTLGVGTSTSTTESGSPHNVCGVFKFDSVGLKTIRLMYEQLVSGVPGLNSILADRAPTVGQRDIHITVKPFINNEQITASFKQIDDAIQAIPNQNLVINGNFDFWQRGTSLGAGTGERYLADRFLVGSTGSTMAPSRQSFALGQSEVPNSPKFFHRSVVVSSAGDGNRATFQHRIEDVAKLANKTVTLSFWAKADSNKQMSIEFIQNFGTGGSPSSQVLAIGVQKINLTSSWQKFTRTVTLPDVIGKTLGTNNNDFLNVVFWFDAGSSLNSRTDSLGHQSGTFDIAQVKLEEGSVATPFVLAGGTIQGELAACQRYYEINGGGYRALFSGRVVSGNAYRAPVVFKSTKRTSPIITLTNQIAGGFATTTGSIEFNGISGFVETRNANGTVDNGIFASDWTADAEL